MKYKYNYKMLSTIENKISILISKEENRQIFSLFGSKCQSLATAVIQLYVTQGPDHMQWFKKETGVMCFIKDHMKRNYFFRLYCPNRRMLIWEQELYNNFEYKSPLDFFHMFEGDDYICGLNFASEDEAHFMRVVVLEKLEIKKQKREERRLKNAQMQGTIQSNQDSISSPFQSNISMNNEMNFGHNSSYPQGNFLNKTKKRRQLTKADISHPSDFKHVSHIGWDPNKGFDVNVEDPQLKKFFTKAGISDYQLRDEETRKFIYDFILNHGGLDAVRSDLSHETASPYLPPRNMPDAYPPNPPPVPARSTANRSAPPPPPPPSKTRSSAQSRGQPPRPEAHHPAPRPPPISNTPVPPPPPPISGLNSSPPPPPMSGLNSTPQPPPRLEQSAPRFPDPQADPRSALLESIRLGKSLKPVEQVEKKPIVEDSRSDLLHAIRQGIELKPVQNIIRLRPKESAPSNGLAGLLSEALKCRARAIQSDSGSDSGNSTDDDEWNNEE